MTDDPFYREMRELAWQRKLNPEEEARLAEWLATHPRFQAEWDSEAGLNELLAGLPNVPVASNFTARVLAAAQSETTQSQYKVCGPRGAAAWWRRWMPKAALAAVVVAAGLLSYNHFQSARRAEWAESLAAVSQVTSVPSPEVLNDFDAVAALGSTPPPDEELLKLMQ